MALTMSIRKKTRKQLLADLVDEYVQVKRLEEFDLEDVSRWAVQTGRYHMPKISPEAFCHRELSRACRATYIKDENGRDVRRMHPIRLVSQTRQYHLWADITTAKPKHMRMSFQQRRQAILSDCLQHKTDVEWYNANNRYKQQLPLFDYNFNLDIQEREMPEEYNENHEES